MNENTRKYYITQGEEFEKASNYEDALSSYLEAFSVKECVDDDNPDYFKPGFLEDRIAFLAYCIGEYRIALTFGAKAYRADPDDQRIKNNLPFYTDAILFTNPKERLDEYTKSYLINNFPKNSTILDVGPMDGRWSYQLRDNFSNMDAIEIFAPYIEQFNLKEKYNNVFCEDIRTFEFEHYDIIILGDVLEHLPIIDAQKLVKRLSSKCNQLVAVVPYEYPQDKYDNNEYQIHHQEDLTVEVMEERYPALKLFAKDEVRGVYLTRLTNLETKIFYPEFTVAKTLTVGKKYYDDGNFSLAAGVFSNSLERMNDSSKAALKFYLGNCYKNLDKSLEALKSYVEATEIIKNLQAAYFEILKILEKNELWGDMEYYLRKALDEKNEPCFGDKIDSWESLLCIQMTLALSKQKKLFEAYGFAALALEFPMDEQRKRIAEYNFEELKKELWSTLQI